MPSNQNFRSHFQNSQGRQWFLKLQCANEWPRNAANLRLCWSRTRHPTLLTASGWPTDRTLWGDLSSESWSRSNFTSQVKSSPRTRPLWVFPAFWSQLTSILRDLFCLQPPPSRGTVTSIHLGIFPHPDEGDRSYTVCPFPSSKLGGRHRGPFILRSFIAHHLENTQGFKSFRKLVNILDLLLQDFFPYMYTIICFTEMGIMVNTYLCAHYKIVFSFHKKSLNVFSIVS